MLKPATQKIFAGSYAVASYLYRVWHGLRRKNLRGAQAAVWTDNKVLLIRNTYRNTFGFPGGYVASGEEAVTAAQRELEEEVGIWCSRSQLQLAFVNEYVDGRAQGRDWIFETVLEFAPALTLDLREIESAAFYDLRTALELPLERHVRRFLEAVPVSQHAAQCRAAA